MKSTQNLSSPTLNAEYAIKQESKSLKEKLKILDEMIRTLEQDQNWRHLSNTYNENNLILAAKKIYTESDKLRYALRDKALLYLEDKYMDALCIMQPILDTTLHLLRTAQSNNALDPEVFKQEINDGKKKLTHHTDLLAKRVKTYANHIIGAINMFVGAVSALVGVLTANWGLGLVGGIGMLFGNSLMKPNQVQRQTQVLREEVNQFGRFMGTLFQKPREQPMTSSEPKQQAVETLYPAIHSPKM